MWRGGARRGAVRQGEERRNEEDLGHYCSCDISTIPRKGSRSRALFQASLRVTEELEGLRQH